MKNIPKIKTILFSEECNLHCRYCANCLFPDYKLNPAFTKQEFLSAVEDATHEGVSRLYFTGGEPLLYWDWIKEVIEKYGTTFDYEFNTNGYYLTEDKLEFLVNYACIFNLSVDGPREISLYQRPNNGNYKFDYWDTVVKNFPAILYYFPNTPWKSILSKRLIPFMPKIYDAAMRYGFRTLDLQIDFGEQPWRENHQEGVKAWGDKEWEEYEKSMQAISLMMVNALEDEKWPTLTSLSKKCLIYILNKGIEDSPFTADDIACGVVGDREIVTVQAKESMSCLRDMANTMKMSPEDYIKKLNEDYKLGCQNDKNCEFFDFCARYLCIKDAVKGFGHPYRFAPDYCQEVKIVMKNMLLFLKYCNQYLKNSKIYHAFLGSFLNCTERRLIG